jgi:ABC-type Fe3+-hydroxamate transport system substrate-binding protein
MYVTDHLQRTVFLPKPPERIISLVPSQTELLVDLGLGDRLVGLTKFCVYPAHLRKNKAIVGGTKNYRYELIESLSLCSHFAKLGDFCAQGFVLTGELLDLGLALATG